MKMKSNQAGNPSLLGGNWCLEAKLGHPWEWWKGRMKQISAASGTQIRILTRDKIPSYALPSTVIRDMSLKNEKIILWIFFKCCMFYQFSSA